MSRSVLSSVHSNLAIPELAIADPLLSRTDCAKICQSGQFRRDNFLLYRIPYLMDSRGAAGIDTGINHIEIFIATV